MKKINRNNIFIVCFGIIGPRTPGLDFVQQTSRNPTYDKRDINPS